MLLEVELFLHGCFFCYQNFFYYYYYHHCSNVVRVQGVFDVFGKNACLSCCWVEVNIVSKELIWSKLRSEPSLLLTVSDSHTWVTGKRSQTKRCVTAVGNAVPSRGMGIEKVLSMPLLIMLINLILYHFPYQFLWFSFREHNRLMYVSFNDMLTWGCSELVDLI